MTNKQRKTIRKLLMQRNAARADKVGSVTRAEHEAEVTTLRTGYEVRIAELEKQRAAAAEEWRTWEKRHGEVTNKLIEATVQTLQAKNRIDDLTAELSQLRTERASLQAALEQANAQLGDTDVKKLRRRLQEAHEENKKLGQRLEEIAADDARVEKLTAENAHMANMVLGLEATLLSTQRGVDRETIRTALKEQGFDVAMVDPPANPAAPPNLDSSCGE